MKKYSVSLLYLFSITLMLFSYDALPQEVDYSQQIAAMRTGFHNRSTDGLRDMLSPELKFGPIPAEKTLAVLTQVFTKFPVLNSLEIIEEREGYALVKYNFEGSRGTESGLHFDKSGKITRIELIEQVIEKEIELSRSVAHPDPGELGKKYPPEPIIFESSDGLKVTGNLFEVDPNAPVILLCHQGGFNKFEYADIAPKLNQLGFNSLAIDQRSGGSFAGHENETFNRATKQGLNTDFLEAERDIEAAIHFLKRRYKKKVIIWGSSYSSILVLFLANNKDVNAIISFSPSDFFKEDRPLIADVINNIKKPYFITSSKNESEKLTEIMQSVEQRSNQIHFVPKSDGFHGSRSLWKGQAGAKEYWTAIEKFLAVIYSQK